MSPSASVALDFQGVQNASEANRTVVKGSSSLEFGPGKHLAKLRCMVSFANGLNLSAVLFSDRPVNMLSFHEFVFLSCFGKMF
jgi:hypothetical protein